jgi:hypothetical protein
LNKHKQTTLKPENFFPAPRRHIKYPIWSGNSALIGKAVPKRFFPLEGANHVLWRYFSVAFDVKRKFVHLKRKRVFEDCGMEHPALPVADADLRTSSRSYTSSVRQIQKFFGSSGH